MKLKGDAPSAYDTRFYAHLTSNARSSAEEMAPFVYDLVRPDTIVDLGCGQGTWLAAFLALGAVDVLGFDGPWVDPDSLLVPRTSFVSKDLAKPVQEGRRFDLAISLEVAEHLETKAAATLVDSLVGLSDVVLFSAAIPHQEGTAHLNEQWPEYWAALFSARGYRVVDCLRLRFWANPKVSWWYAQNAMLFVRTDQLARYPRLAAVAGTDVQAPLRFVHPDKFLAMVWELEQVAARQSSTVLMGQEFLRTLGASIARRLRGFWSHPSSW